MYTKMLFWHYIFLFGATVSNGQGLLFHEVSISQRRTTVGKTPLDEWSVRRRDLYLTTNNTRNRQTSMAPVGFEPTISAGERPQTYTLDLTATGTGVLDISSVVHMTRRNNVLSGKNECRVTGSLFRFLQLGNQKFKDGEAGLKVLKASEFVFSLSKCVIPLLENMNF